MNDAILLALLVGTWGLILGYLYGRSEARPAAPRPARAPRSKPKAKPAPVPHVPLTLFPGGVQGIAPPDNDEAQDLLARFTTDVPSITPEDVEALRAGMKGENPPNTYNPDAVEDAHLPWMTA